MEDIGYVFISYSPRDSNFIGRLTEDLHAAGFRTWIDREQIEPGENLAATVPVAVLGARALVAVLSKSSIVNDVLTAELTYGKRYQKPILPVVIDKSAAKYQPSVLQGYNRIDFERSYESGLASLQSQLSRLIVADAPIGASPTKTKGYVFLSYAEEDRQFIEQLRSFLAKHRYAYWDFAESDRDYHGQMYLELEKVIREAVATLSILTPAWKLSKWTIKEHQFSEEVGTPVFLLMVKETGPILALTGLPYIDFTNNTQQGFERLHRELQRQGL